MSKKLINIGIKAKKASKIKVDKKNKNKVLKKYLQLINKNKKNILKENNKDIEFAIKNNLPDNLIASFRSTLSEIIDSNLLLKIIDVSSPEYSNHLISIDNVLKYLNINEKKYLIIFNKVDLVDNKNLIKNLKVMYPDSIFVSGFKKINIDLILKKIKFLMNKKSLFR